LPCMFNTYEACVRQYPVRAVNSSSILPFCLLLTF
jgi:hypothetical protein